MLHDPQQELFTRLIVDIKALGYDVYDGALPPENTPYPFVYLGDFRQSDTGLKGAIIGNVYPTIHVWHNSPKKRGTSSQMMYEIKMICRHIEKTENYSWLLNSVNQRIITDTTTKQPLLHGILELGFLFS